jgi:lysophospholipase L1-like esterase
MAPYSRPAAALGGIALASGAMLLLLALWSFRSSVLPRFSVQRAGRVDVTFVGDSITAGADWQDAFPDLVISNQGVSGDTTTDVLARLPSIRATGARTYLVMLGINDILRGSSARDVALRMNIIQTELQSGGRARVILQSTLPCQRSFCGQEALDRVVDLNQRLKGMAGEKDFLDLHQAMVDASGSLRPAYSSDGLHLSGWGYGRWKQLLAPVIAQLPR